MRTISQRENKARNYCTAIVALLLSCIIIFCSIPVFAAANLEEGITELANQISQDMKEKGKKKIAVVAFSNLDGSITAFGQHLAEELITALFITSKGQFEVVERRQLRKVLAEQKLSMSGFLDAEAMKSVGKILGIEALVTGSCTDLDSKVKVNARMISVESAKIFAVARTSIPKIGIVAKLMNAKYKQEESLQTSDVAEPTASSSAKNEQNQSSGKVSKGIKAEYYNLRPFETFPSNLPSDPTLTQIINNIDFDWKGNSPASIISANFFGIKMTFFLSIPVTATYALGFEIRDSLVQLSVDGKLVLEAKKGRYDRYFREHVFLESDKLHSLTIQYFAKGESPKLKFYWIPPGKGEKEIIPPEYFKYQE